MSEKKILDDTWTYQNVGTPFPSNGQKAPGESNKYVALWYKHGRPVMGMAWNDSGVVKCEFTIDKKMYTGTDVGGTIQLLTYEGTHVTKFFYYDWVTVAKLKSSSEGIYEQVRCGNAAPVFWKEKGLLGNYDIEKQLGTFAEMKEKPKELICQDPNQLYVIVRVTSGGPPFCQCDVCLSEKQPRTLKKPLSVNDWEDYNWGSPWPKQKPIIAALNKALKTPSGPQEQFVALWYRHGKPVMGRAWNNNGKIDASFVDGLREFTGQTVGSMQLLVQMPATAVGYDYVWLPYEQAHQFRDKDFLPVHMDYVCPVIIAKDGYETLGCVDMKTETATVALNGKIISLEGGQVKSLLVLCRREHYDTMVI